MDWIVELKSIIDFLNGLVSPVLATTVAYIAYQQWKTNDRKEKRESRETKVSIYKIVKAHLNYIDSTREVRADLYEEFKSACAEADFVFPKEVTEYLDQIDINSFQWLIDKESLDCAAPNADKVSINKMEIRMEEYIDKLQESHCELFEMFEKDIKK